MWILTGSFFPLSPLKLSVVPRTRQAYFHRRLQLNIMFVVLIHCKHNAGHIPFFFCYLQPGLGTPEIKSQQELCHCPDLNILPRTQAAVKTKTDMGHRNSLVPGRKVPRNKNPGSFGGKVPLDYTATIKPMNV